MAHIIIGRSTGEGYSCRWADRVCYFYNRFFMAHIIKRNSALRKADQLGKVIRDGGLTGSVISIIWIRNVDIIYLNIRTSEPLTLRQIIDVSGIRQRS